jgi:glycosyltransferase involved in cell wall biosynthesis
MADFPHPILFLEPFYGGSHRAFADGLVSRSRHRIDLFTMPDRFWKWRMRGAALHFTRKVTDPGAYDGLITTDLMSLSDLRALWGTACPPALVYFHENQLSYPLPPGETMDYQFAFTDITTGLAADRILFNSCTHEKAFFRDLESFLRILPDYRPGWVVDEIRRRSGVLHPGCDLPAGGSGPAPRDPARPPLIIWNHRWEFDKQPEVFFTALDAVHARGREFEVALLGENFQFVPKEFLAARERLGGRIVQYGYVEDRRAYLDWLRRGSIVISTAVQENFGIAVVEAIGHGCLPLLPNRLSYPELLLPEHHSLCLYDDSQDLIERLDGLLADPGTMVPHREPLAASMQRFSWNGMQGRWDDELDRLARSNQEV